jgi:threonine/homoserine/homoserine lactone efflux protein
MTFERWLAFVGVMLVLVCTPGPDFAVVVRHALADRRHGVGAAAGIVTGLAVHTTAAAVGLSALVAAHPGVLTGIRVAGAAYLVLLGLQALRSALPASRGAHATPQRSGRPYVDGLAGNLLNPKALLLFLGLLPQFVAPGRGVVGQILLLAATIVVIVVLWYALVIGLAGRSRGRLRRAGARRAVNAVTGTALMAVATTVMLG